MNTTKQLERQALDAHRRGVGWTDFWQQHGEEVRAVEPYDRGRFYRLLTRLLGLLTSGDCDGQEPVDPEPWLGDDQPEPNDAGTQARCLLPPLEIEGGRVGGMGGLRPAS
jgi:hypothetical protein